MFKAVIFDLDGVLVDSHKSAVNVEVAILRRYGVDLDFEFATRSRGMGATEYFQLMKDHYGADFSVKEAVGQYQKMIDEYYRHSIPLVPHVPEILAWLKGQDLRIGLGTSSRRENAEGVLKRHGVWDFFEASTCGDEVAQVKPAPDIYLATMKKLEVTAEEVLIVEDSESGMQAAKNAGAKLVGRRAEHNRHLDFALCDAVVNDLLDLEKIIIAL